MPNKEEKNFAGFTSILLLLLLVIIAQYPALNNGFVYDDDMAIKVNHLVTNAEFVDIWTNDIWGTTGKVNSGTYRPVMVTSFALQWHMFPNSSFFFHLLNCILLCICVLLCFFFLKKLMSSELAWLAAAVFALHPVNSEVVHNIIQRSEILATIFVLSYLTLLVDANGKEISLKNKLAAIICFALALLSKENAVVAPLLLVLVTRYNPQNNNGWFETVRKTWGVLAGSLMVFVGYYLARLMALGSFSRNVPYEFNPTMAFDLLWRHLNSGWLGLHYLFRFFNPFPQPMEWVYNQLPVFGPDSSSFMILVWLMVVLIAVYTIKGLKNKSLQALGLMWFAIAIFPVIQAIVSVTVLFADRCLFLPGIGLSVFAVSFGNEIVRRINVNRHFVMLLLSAFILFLVAYQIFIADRWKDNLTLFASLAENSPRCANVQSGYGKFLYQEGKLKESELYLLRAKAIYGYNLDTLFWLGKVQIYGQKYSDAIDNWKTIEKISHPDNLPKYRKLQKGVVLKLGKNILKTDPKSVLPVFQFFTSIDPEDFPARALETIALYRLGRNDEFISSYDLWQKRFSSNNDNYRYLGILRMYQKKFSEAADSYEKYLRAKPQDVEVMYQRALALSRAGRFSEAIIQMKKLLQINNKTDLHDELKWLEFGFALRSGF